MSDPFSEGDIAKTIDHPLMVAPGAALAWLTAGRSPAIGSALAALLSIAGGIAFLAFSLMLPSLSWNPWRRRRPGRIARVRELCQTSGKSRQRRLAGASLCPQANRISQRGRQLLRRCGHGKPHALSACVWSQNPGPAMDPARLRPLSFSRIGLPHSNDLYHLGCVRQARPPLPSRFIPSAQAQSLLALPLSARSLVRAGLPAPLALRLRSPSPLAWLLAWGAPVRAPLPGLSVPLPPSRSELCCWLRLRSTARRKANFCCFLYPR